MSTNGKLPVMKYLLDTHVLIWMAEASERLCENVADLLQNSNAENLAVSAITPWEIAKKVSLGKLGLSLPLADWLGAVTGNRGLRIVPLSVDISIDANTLPGEFHKDPADQIIVASARKYSLQLITADRRILAYPHVHTINARK